MSVITVKEYDCLVRDPEPDTPLGTCAVGHNIFDHLQQLHATDSTINKVLTPVITKTRQNGLKIGGYAGVLQTPDGTQLEILPKITAAGEDTETARRILIQMLRFLGPYQQVLETSLPAAVRMAHMPLLEIFIALFLEAVKQLVRRGLRFSYSRHRSNQMYCRGRLLIDRQIRHNLTHPERFFVEYDRFSPNRPANRLIRSTLDTVRFLTNAPDNQRLLRELSFALADIPPSSNYRSDFQLVNLDREMGLYPPVLDWCRIILEENSPLTTASAQDARSLLFKMPEVFEKYVAGCLSRQLPPQCNLITQARNETKYLTMHQDKKSFRLKPDILITNTHANQTIAVMDTKWKLLDKNQKHYGLDQNDLYQMFAYGHKYLHGEGDMALIYPKTPEFTCPPEPFLFSDRLQLHILPFDLENEHLISPNAELFGISNRLKAA